jgi:hypothetical protein
MNSTGTNIDDVEILDLTADTDDESNQPLLPPIPVTNSDSNSNSNSNSLPRRYRQGGATFTANPQGCFEVRIADVVPMLFNLSLLTFVSF